MFEFAVPKFIYFLKNNFGTKTTKTFNKLKLLDNQKDTLKRNYSNK